MTIQALQNDPTMMLVAPATSRPNVANLQGSRVNPPGSRVNVGFLRATGAEAAGDAEPDADRDGMGTGMVRTLRTTNTPVMRTGQEMNVLNAGTFLQQQRGLMQAAAANQLTPAQQAAALTVTSVAAQVTPSVIPPLFPEHLGNNVNILV